MEWWVPLVFPSSTHGEVARAAKSFSSSRYSRTRLAHRGHQDRRPRRHHRPRQPRILRRGDDTLTPGVLAPDIPTFVLRADIVDRAVRLDAANRACESSLLNLASAGAKIIQYAVPVSESTTETLHNVDYKDYQISMYPTGNTPIENNGQENIIWQAPSAQDPNFAATNATAQLNGEKNLFISGVLWGIVGGAAVACLDHFYEAYRERKKKPPGRQVPL